jgi:tetratricopeptide (TPR) repeat protein
MPLSPAFAQTLEDPRNAQAHRLVVEGRCTAALELLGKLTRDLPSDPKPLFWTAQCDVERADYAAAQAALDAAVALDPNDGEARLLLAIALYHQEEFARSSEELETAARLLGAERAEIDLYRGLLLLTKADEGAARSGAAWLEHARVLDQDAVEPMASFYAGLGWSTGREKERARAALERVVREWPNTDWSRQAQHMLDRLGPGGRGVWGSLRTGFEYDSNAVLQGQGAALPEEISSQRDIRGVWQGQIGSELLRRGDWSLGGSASYSGSVYRDIQSFDSQFPGGALWIDRRLDEATTLRLLVDTGYAFVDLDDFLWTSRATLSAIRQWPILGTTEAFARYWHDDYFVHSDNVLGANSAGFCTSSNGALLDVECGPPGLDERRERDRDGEGFAVGFVQTTALPIEWPYGSITIRGGYQFETFDARGKEYGYHAHTIAGGVHADLPWRFALSVDGSFSWRPYVHPTTFPDPPIFGGVEYTLSPHDRNETTGIAAVTLERPITSWLLGSIGWRYERNVSNSTVFDYDRTILGAYLTATFGPFAQ